ncbi:MAG: bifunctional folylpolyglutamate synthase/dihydrofolate synthase [Proteobacteria bacterium]|nr:bifunctional folylpolyglutamate synthase/dihydrofolate synthase [Pseudomonadota bacterium]
MSHSGSSLADWLLRLESFSPQEIQLGLERVLAVIERLDLAMPDTTFHIAGTNGKGSSVAFAQALLSASGAVVGTYTSPHVFEFNERICIDAEAATDAEIIAAFERIDAARGDTALTYFEFGTIAALIVFEARDVDIQILEVGMGGRLDAVNAVEPTAGLITNISLDHCDWLGDNVESIAREKAGIMRAGKCTVFASPEMPESIAAVAVELGAKLVLADRDYHWSSTDTGWSWQSAGQRLDKLQRPLMAGEFQIDNAAGVLALLVCAGFAELLCVERIDRAFAKPALPGRMQTIMTDRRWLFDVAHNPAAAEVLATALAGEEFDATTVAIIGLLDDKDVEGIISPLAGQVDYWISVTTGSSRAMDASEIGRQVANITNKACMLAESLQQAIEHARKLTTAEDRILVTGSFYLVGPALRALGIYSPGKGKS